MLPASKPNNTTLIPYIALLLLTRLDTDFAIKVAVRPRGPRMHCVISYVHIQRFFFCFFFFSTESPQGAEKGKQREIRACAWGQNNSPAIHSTVFIRRLRLRELLWTAGTHAKTLPSNDERRARRLVQRDGSPHGFYERNYFIVQVIEESMRRRKSHNENYFL